MGEAADPEGACSPTMMGSHRRSLAGAVASVLVLAACATGGPRFESAPAPTATSVGATSTSMSTSTTTTTTTTTTTPAPAATTARAVVAAALTDYPAQPVGVPFPTYEWPAADLPNVVSRLVLDRATDAAFGPADAQTRVQSIVVLGGEVVYERYHPLDGPAKRYNSFSVAKSFTSALVGLAVADGELTEDETSLRPEWIGDGREDISLADLLQMSSGLQWDEDYSAPSDVINMINAPDAAAFVAAKPLESAPGTVFEYSTGTTALLVDIVADRLDGCAATTEYLNERLFDKIGITSEELLPDDGGCWLGGLGANMTTRDFARFGLLYLRGGEWDGEQVLPTSWIDASRTPAGTNPGYGYQWWLDGSDDVFEARGLLGQLIVVVPSLDVVIAINSAGGDSDSLAQAVLDELRAPTGPDPVTPSTTTTTTAVRPTLPPTG